MNVYQPTTTTTITKDAERGTNRAVRKRATRRGESGTPEQSEWWQNGREPSSQGEKAYTEKNEAEKASG